MIKVNGQEFPWEEGMTVRRLLELKKYNKIGAVQLLF